MARYAIVIGIATNLSPLKSLSKTAGDAGAIADLLEAHGDFVEVKRLMGEVSQRQIETALQMLLLEQADRNEVVIYYTGHGFPLVESFGRRRVYLAPSDCRVTVRDGQVVAQDGGIALEGLNGLFQCANLSNLVVFLECCYSGAMLDNTLVRKTMTAFSQTDYVLIAACREFETAYALKGDSHSVFTTALLRGLREKKNDSGQVTTGSLFDFVYEQMRGRGQEPMYLGLGRSLSVVRYQIESILTTIDETDQIAQNMPSLEEQKIILDTESARTINIAIDYLQRRSWIGNLSEIENKRLQELKESVREIIEINKQLAVLGKVARTLLEETSQAIKDSISKSLNEREQVHDLLNPALNLVNQSRIVNDISNILIAGEEAATWLKRNRSQLIERTIEELQELYPEEINESSEKSVSEFKWILRKYIKRIEFSLEWCDKRLLEEPDQLRAFKRSMYLKAFQFIRNKRISDGGLDLSSQALQSLLEYFDHFIHQLR